MPLQRETANESAVCAEQMGGLGQYCQPFFQRYHLGVHGACDNFEPPAGYWCYTGDYGYKQQPKVPLGPGEGGRPVEVEGGMAGPYGWPTGPSREKVRSRSLRRALLMPQVHPGSLYRCGKST